MCDGNNEDLRFVTVMARRENDRARAVFCAFLAALAMFLQPEI
jgi:hypothetical protein